MAEADIIDAVRTPRSTGKMGKGTMSHMHPTSEERKHFDTVHIDDIIRGSSAQLGRQGDMAPALIIERV